MNTFDEIIRINEQNRKQPSLRGKILVVFYLVWQICSVLYYNSEFYTMLSDVTMIQMWLSRLSALLLFALILVFYHEQFLKILRFQIVILLACNLLSYVIPGGFLSYLQATLCYLGFALVAFALIVYFPVSSQIQLTICTSVTVYILAFLLNYCTVPYSLIHTILAFVFTIISVIHFPHNVSNVSFQENTECMPGTLLTIVCSFIFIISGFTTVATPYIFISATHRIICLTGCIVAGMYILVHRKTIRFLHIAKLYLALSAIGLILAITGSGILWLEYLSAFLLSTGFILNTYTVILITLMFQRYPSKCTILTACTATFFSKVIATAVHFFTADTSMQSVNACLSVIMIILYLSFESDLYLHWTKHNRKPEEQPEQPKPFADLPPQQQALAGLILQGYSGQEIADIMHITLGTMKGYRNQLYTRLNIHSRRELFELAQTQKKGQ
ncbi:MAG: helix-turn-helix transcriptional regulator [Erysipelotrichaceae bacterium]|nr:helix-turn-helix transcriptional regulator [Erysipelotrichaceae bacterium]